MARLVIDHPAPPGGWEVVRPRLQKALAEDLPVPLEERWEGGELRLRGAGVTATIRLVGDHLRAEADLRPPASFFHRVIERELRDALERAWPVDGGGDPAQSRGRPDSG